MRQPSKFASPVFVASLTSLALDRSVFADNRALLSTSAQRRFVELAGRFPDDQVGGIVDHFDAQGRSLFLQKGAALRDGAAILLAGEQQQRHADFFKPLIQRDAATLRLARFGARDEQILRSPVT